VASAKNLAAAGQQSELFSALLTLVSKACIHSRHCNSAHLVYRKNTRNGLFSSSGTVCLPGEI